MNKIGEYLLQPTGYKAFIPAPFPSKDLISWDADLIYLLSEADRAIGQLNAIDQLIPDVDFFIFMYVKKEAVLSSQIEGTQATLLDVVKAEARLVKKDSSSDVDEILNYIEAMNYGLKRLKTFPLSLRLIREIHQKLLRGVRGQHKAPGEFRTTQNWIGGPSLETASFIPPPISEIARVLSDLEHFLYDESSKLPILIKTGLINAQFETIHPFLDGNGRMGRLLITFYLCQKDVLGRPLLYISDFFKQHRQDYYERLNRYRFDDGIGEWLKFFLEGVRSVSQEAISTAKKITAIRERHIQSVSRFGRNAETALKLLNKLYSLPAVDSESVARITGLSSKTSVNNLIRKFIKAGILVEISGRERNQRFVYKEYLNQFSRERIDSK